MLTLMLLFLSSQLSTGGATSCNQTFDGSNMAFDVCKDNDEFPAGFSVYWTIDENPGTLRVLFEVVVNDSNKWAALGFSSASSNESKPMIGSNVVFGCGNIASNAADSDYYLGGKSQESATNEGNLKLSDRQKM